MQKIKDITSYLESLAPLSYQENYDNSGLLTGNYTHDVNGVLICLDCTEAVIDEAIKKKCNLIISHHPIIFSGIKQLTGKNYIERTVIKALKNDIAIYAIHTNLDNVIKGVSGKIAEVLELTNLSILSPKSSVLQKIVAFVPTDHTEKVLAALYEEGAGNVGNYSNCSFKVVGKGSFLPNDVASPFIGQPNQAEEVEEERIELIFPTHLQHRVIQKLKEVHPYEEVAYYITHLENHNQQVGSGIIAELKEPMSERAFFEHLKQKMSLTVIRHTSLLGKEVKRIAICGGSGSFLLPKAKKANADVFITADFKYHEFFDAENEIVICDIGHYESEVYTKDLIFEILNKKFASFATCLSEVNTNPISYF